MKNSNSFFFAIISPRPSPVFLLHKTIILFPDIANIKTSFQYLVCVFSKYKTLFSFLYIHRRNNERKKTEEHLLWSLWLIHFNNNSIEYHLNDFNTVADWICQHRHTRTHIHSALYTVFISIFISFHSYHLKYNSSVVCSSFNILSVTTYGWI